MPICELCNEEFKTRIQIDGKYRNLANRKYCLNCSSWGSHNTKKLGDRLRDDNSKLKRKCKICGETNDEKFYQKNRTLCSVCRNKQSLLRFKSYKQAAVDYKGGKCNMCGYNKSIAALEFHHTDPTVKDTEIFNKMSSRTLERNKEELDKCILLCANCHREEHCTY